MACLVEVNRAGQGIRICSGRHSERWIPAKAEPVLHTLCVLLCVHLYERFVGLLLQDQQHVERSGH